MLSLPRIVLKVFNSRVSQILQVSVEGFVVFISADAQALTGGQHYIIAAVTGNAACVDQI